ncbi:penicillin-binding protein activator [Acidithiobacillus sp.]|uniref:penicillin-binding protein activator n=1 Tax=Acidithiobacillus sp. TaxID=1872118 RepID=UPI0025BC7F05|nr:penicillin-binding protein activator [Acidithiobacillus sp.]
MNQRSFLETGRRSALVLLAALGLGACASMPQSGGEPPRVPARATPAPEPSSGPTALAAQAERLQQQGHDLAAAKAYIQAAAETRSDAQVAYLLQASRASLAGNKPQVAVLLADEVLRLAHDPKLRGEALWVRARGLMDQGQTPQAKGNLEELLTIDSTPPEVRAAALGELATIFRNEKHDLTALNFLIQRDSLLAGPDKTENHRRIRALLDAQSSAKLKNWQGRSGNPIVQEWLAFALIARENPEPAAREAAFSQWLQQHPGHPVIHWSADESLPTATADTRGDICALLPQSASYAALSQALAAGLETAAQLRAGPPVHVIDTTGNPSFTSVLFQRGVQAGCVAFVGPWLEQDIRAVASVRKPSDPPVLSLGEVAGLKQDGLYQLPMGRGDAARQIAAGAYRAGYRAAAVIYPQDSSGASIQADFLARWKKEKGTVLGVASFIPGSGRVDGAVQQALSGVIGRHSMVFLVAGKRDLATSIAAIRATNASIPVFVVDSDADDALPVLPNASGPVYAVETPWAMHGEPLDSRARSLLHQELPQASSAQWQLAGVGLDAYALIQAIVTKQTAEPIDGVTGRLHFAAHGNIDRDMPWVQIGPGGVQRLSQLPPAGP